MTRLRFVSAIAVVSSVAVAAPVPKPPPPINAKGEISLSLGVAKLVDNKIEFATVFGEPMYTPGAEGTSPDGTPTVGPTLIRMKSRPATMLYGVKWTKVTTADGKVVDPADLAKKIGQGVPAAVSNVPHDLEWRKLLPADTLYLEPFLPQDPRQLDKDTFPVEKK